jgi:hypothetical protein
MHCFPGCRADAGKLLRVRERLCPMAASPVAWNGLGPAPTEDTQPLKPKKPARAKREIVVGPNNAAPGGRRDKVQSTESLSIFSRQQRLASAILSD